VGYPAATWNPAAPRNFRTATRPGGFFFGDPITYIVIHTTEGSTASAIRRFQKPSERVSAHYIISSDGRITQMVREQDNAWHSGNPEFNRHSIGIEHEAISSQPASHTDRYHVPVVSGPNSLPLPQVRDPDGSCAHHRPQ
jgi:hypothetical protein